MSRTIALLGSLDTKGDEYALVKDCIEAREHRTLLIDVGVLGQPRIMPDVLREEVTQAAGVLHSDLKNKADRGESLAVMARGAAEIVPRLYDEGRFDAILAIGGGGGTSVATAAMRALPLGVPKVMVSTVAGHDTSPYVGISDIVMIPSVVDVAGINRISRATFARAAGAVCGMVETIVPRAEDRPLITASMNDHTTDCVETARKILEKAGYEVLIFQCTGTGGRTMERLIESGQIAGVLDITTTELADELVGGVLSAGPGRLDAAARSGVPAIVAPGCLDMVNFWTPDTIPAEFHARTFYPQNQNITLMRTTTEECRQLGEIIAAKLNESNGPVTVLLPLAGVSVIDSVAGPFWHEEAGRALFDAIKTNIRDDIPVIEMDCNVNAPEFAHRCAETLLENIVAADKVLSR